MKFRVVALAGVAGSIVCVVGCIPLTVGSTAKPVPMGTTVHSTSVYVVPNSFDDTLDSRSFPRYGVDNEVRFGFDDHSDIGVRIPSFSGIVANYKRRLNGVTEAPGAATSIMVGGGIVNWGEHAHLEATLITSAAESDRFTPYGGLRAMQVIPIDRGAVHDLPPPRCLCLDGRGRAQRLMGGLMNQATFHLSFPTETPARRSQLSMSLGDSLQSLDQVSSIELVRENPDSQDAGTILSIVLSAPAVALAVRAIAAWATRNNQARIDITTADGTVVVSGLDSADVPKAIRALDGVLRSP